MKKWKILFLTQKAVGMQTMNKLAFSSQTGDEWTVEDRKVIPEENKMDYLDGKRTLFELRDEFEKASD